MGHHEHNHKVNARDGNRRALAVVLILTARLEELLTNEYGISHTTLQVDHVGDHHTTLRTLRFPSRLD